MCEKEIKQPLWIEGMNGAKTCPFCGSEDVTLVNDYADEEVSIFNYMCEECEAYASERYVIEGTDWYESEDEEEEEE